MNTQIELRRWAVEQAIASGASGPTMIESEANSLIEYVLGEPSDHLTEQLVEAALRFTFRNTLRPQPDADQKLEKICAIASKIQQQRHPDKRWDTGV